MSSTWRPQYDLVNVGVELRSATSPTHVEAWIHCWSSPGVYQDAAVICSKAHRRCPKIVETLGHPNIAGSLLHCLSLREDLVGHSVDRTAHGLNERCANWCIPGRI